MWNRSKCPAAEMNVVYVHSGILFVVKKKAVVPFAGKMDEAGDNYIK